MSEKEVMPGGDENQIKNRWDEQKGRGEVIREDLRGVRGKEEEAGRFRGSGEWKGRVRQGE